MSASPNSNFKYFKKLAYFAKIEKIGLNHKKKSKKI